MPWAVDGGPGVEGKPGIDFRGDVAGNDLEDFEAGEDKDAVELVHMGTNKTYIMIIASKVLYSKRHLSRQFPLHLSTR